MSKFITPLIILAILIRLVLAVFTHHADLGALALAGKAIAGEGKILTFYDSVNVTDSSGTHLNIYQTVFNYQPLAYLIPSAFYLPFRNIVLQTGELVRDEKFVTQNPAPLNFQLLLYKYPMILADLALLWLLPQFFADKKKKNLVVLLWAFNPIAIYVSSMLGQVDIYIALFLAVGLLAYQKNRPFLASVLIAISALFKPAGLIIFPLIGLHYYVTKKNLLKSLLIVATGFGIYLLGILPYLHSVTYKYYALFAEQIGKSTYAGISIASGTDIPFFFIFFALTIVLIWKKKISLSTATTVALLSSLVFSHFHPQWLIWIMPWFIISAVKSGDYFMYLLTSFCWLAILLSFDSTLNLGLFLHSRLSLPPSLTSFSYFKDIILMARAGLVAVLVWMMVDYEKN
jgi:hypothetical protein